MISFVTLQTVTCRRILVPDTSPCLFHKFLGYLYSGVLDTRSLSLDEVTEMLALSDKYEVCHSYNSYHLLIDLGIFTFVELGD